MRSSAKVTGTGMYVPDRVVTNDDLARLMDTSDEWIRQRSGIVERRYIEPGQQPADLAVQASRRALEAAGREPGEIECIVLATLSAQADFPGTAFFLQEQLGAGEIPCFDLRAQCSGFVYSLGVANALVRSGQFRRMLVVGCEVHSTVIDLSDAGRDVAVLFGDGAGAALVEPCAPGEEGVIDFHNDIDGSGGCNLYMPGGGSLNPPSHETVDKKMHYVHQDGRQVFKYAVRRMCEVPEMLLSRNGFKSSDLDLLVPHQANERIIRATQERLGLSDERVLLNISKYGNTTAGTIPLALVDALNCGRLKKGNLVMLLAVGAGYTTGGMLLRWAY